MVFTCRGSCEQRFVALTAKFVVTLHDGGHVGEGRGGREEGELQRIQHPPQHGCPIDRKWDFKKGTVNASCLAHVVKVSCIKPSASLNDSSPLTWQPALSTAAESGWQLLCRSSRLSPSSHPQTHSHRGLEAILHTMTTHESSLIPRNWFLDQDYQPHSKGFSYQGFRLVVYDNLRSVHTCTRLAVSSAWVVDSKDWITRSPCMRHQRESSKNVLWFLIVLL